MRDLRATYVGGGVWEVGPGAPASLMIEGRPHFRFMDRLMIPGPTQELELASIVAINRWRERVLREGDLPHRALVRRAAIAALAAIGAESVAELGCGKYPLQPELGVADYVGFDIDTEAVDHCREMGLAVFPSPLDGLDRAPGLSAIAALFTFQFPLAEPAADLLSRSGNTCVAIVNVPTKDLDLVAERTAMFARVGMEVTTVEFADVHDRLLVAGRPAAATRCRIAVAILRGVLNGVRRAPDARDA